MEETLKHISITPRKLYFERDDFRIYQAKVNFGEESSEDKEKISVDRYGCISIKGEMQKLNIGENYAFDITKDNSNPSFTNSYNAGKMYFGVPDSVSGQWAYLKSEVTKLQFENISAIYKDTDKIIDIIKSEDFDYHKVKGFGEHHFQALKRRIIADEEKAAFIAEFGNIEGMTSSLASKILNKSTNVKGAIEQLKKNPYSFIEKIEGFTFLIADKIAMQLNFDKNDENRVIACAVYCLEKVFATGDTYTAITDIRRDTRNYDIDRRAFNSATATDLAKMYLHIDKENDIITTRTMYNNEKDSATFIKMLMDNKNLYEKADEWEKLVDDYLTENKLDLTDEQRQFLTDVNKNGFSILVGPGGVGKTWLVNILVNILKQTNIHTTLLAPTGRAAKVMTNYSGIPASTIHKFLLRDFNSEIFMYPNIVVVDETSMLDVELLYTLISKIYSDKTHLVFVGDDYQLPSIGAGNVLHDLIYSQKVPTTKLTKVFRQGKESGIKKIATKIRNNEPITLSEYKDFDDLKVNTFNYDDFELQKQIIADYKKALLDKDVNGLPENILLVVPKNNGTTGRKTLNRLIQDFVNPNDYRKQEYEINKSSEENLVIFREQDRVAIKQNEYDAILVDKHYKLIYEGLEKDIDLTNYAEAAESERNKFKTGVIVNGDVGIITKIIPDKKVIFVKIDDDTYMFYGGDINSFLDLSYALTVHKSQGGQAPYVIFGVDSTNGWTINSNLEYTAITRATKNVVLDIDERTFYSGISKVANNDRKTLLQSFLNSDD